MASTPRSLFDRLAEFWRLFGLSLVVKWRNFLEFCRVVRRYYGNARFRKAHLALIWAYLFRNPFSIHRRFLQARGEKELYTYGETPLTSFELMAKAAEIGPDDVVYELGSGRGTAVLWLGAFIGCKAVGYEIVPTFVDKARQARDSAGLDHVKFYQEDMLQADFSEATCVYFYGTSSTSPFIEALMDRLVTLPKGARVISVSYPLLPYDKERHFEVTQVLTIPFTWGSTEVYIHQKV